MSIVSNKNRGRRFESKTKQMFIDNGHTVIKTSVSDENPDLITFYNGNIYLIEVKSVTNVKKTNVTQQLRTQLEKYKKIKSEIEKQGFSVIICCVVWIKSNNRYKMFMETGIDDVDQFIDRLKEFIAMLQS